MVFARHRAIAAGVVGALLWVYGLAWQTAHAAPLSDEQVERHSLNIFFGDSFARTEAIEALTARGEADVAATVIMAMTVPPLRPMRLRSARMTSCPAFAASMAAYMPAPPEPMTSTSVSRCTLSGTLMLLSSAPRQEISHRRRAVKLNNCMVGSEMLCSWRSLVRVGTDGD